MTLCLSHSNRSDREVRGAGLVLQIVWGFKELRRTLEKDGWKKSDFVVNMNTSTNTRTNGGYEDSSTLPLIDRGVMHFLPAVLFDVSIIIRIFFRRKNAFFSFSHQLFFPPRRKARQRPKHDSTE